eukprot:2256829-Heterocapsa_arctica.AAC.1
MERVRRTAQIRHAAGGAFVPFGLVAFSPEKPWEFAFGMVVQDHCKGFWDQELREPAALYLTE